MSTCPFHPGCTYPCPIQEHLHAEIRTMPRLPWHATAEARRVMSEQGSRGGQYVRAISRVDVAMRRAGA